MPIEKVSRWQVRCDGCDRWSLNAWGTPAMYFSAQDVEQDCIGRGWTIKPEVLCEDCQTIRKERNAK